MWKVAGRNDFMNCSVVLTPQIVHHTANIKTHGRQSVCLYIPSPSIAYIHNKKQNTKINHPLSFYCLQSYSFNFITSSNHTTGIDQHLNSLVNCGTLCLTVFQPPYNLILFSHGVSRHLHN